MNLSGNKIGDESINGKTSRKVQSKNRLGGVVLRLVLDI